MSNQRVLVTYVAPQSFQSSDNWKQVHSALLAQLPLRNIHWSSASRPSIRTIQEIDITLVPLDTIRDERTSQIPVTVLEKPLLNVYFVACEDIETYRSTFKKQIKDWLSSVSQRKNQDWLIVHIVRPDTRAVAGSFFHMKGSVTDKIKADFNTDKRDRCVQLTWSNGQSNPAAWGDTITKLKDGLLSAFDSAISHREDEVKRSESQRSMPGWNFCTFFIVKESLASSFEGVHLFQDALLQYDELEASFFQVLREKNLSWFGSLISPAPKDDSAPLLSIEKKPYRDLILANTISVFDFRIYLLARQCALLPKMGRINEVSRKVGAFLGAFGRRLRDVEITMPPFFVESWTYSSALSVVEQCDVWANDLTPEESTLASFNAGKGELLELARNQLDIIGIKVGHLPSQPPFSMACALSPDHQHSPTDLSSSQNNSTMKITQPELLSALDDKESFYDLYVGVTNRAIDLYAKAGRRKFALKLHGSLAALDVHRGRLESALQTYTSLPAHYAPHMWNSLESLMLSRALDIHADLAKSNNREWIHIVLSFLRTYINNRGHKLLIHEVVKQEYVSKIVAALKVATNELESDLTYPNHPAVSIEASNNARTATDEDGSFLDVTVKNHLSSDLPIDEISVVLAGRETERFRFCSKTDTLPPGKTSLTLFCPTSSPGTFILDSSEARMSRLHLQWIHRQDSMSRASQGVKDHAVLVRIPKDLLAFDIRLSQPDRIELGASPRILVSIFTGRNQVSMATIKLFGPSGVKFKYDEAFFDNNGVGLEITNDSIILKNISKDETVPILVPHSDASSFHAMKVNIDLDYVTATQPSITRTMHITRVVPTSLPIAVNVQDFFRGSRLFSKFTISTTTHQHVRISSAELEILEAKEVDGVKIVGCPPQKRGIVTVTPLQSANFLFYIDSADGASQFVRESLILRIKYRMLREEVESLIKEAVETVIQMSQSWLSCRNVLVNRLIDVLETDATWVEMYGITGELHVPALIGDMGELSGPLSEVKKILESHKHTAGDNWREIKIPVDVPHMNIVAAARIGIISAPFPTKGAHQTPPLYAGQPISASLSVTTSFHWGSEGTDTGRMFKMRFDIEEMVREWLVSGRKRGEFMAKDGSTYTVPITLIALHHGELPLPKVSVTPLPVPGCEPTMGSMALPSAETYQVHGAEKVLVLPRGGRSTFVVGMGGVDL